MALSALIKTDFDYFKMFHIFKSFIKAIGDPPCSYFVDFVLATRYFYNLKKIQRGF